MGNDGSKNPHPPKPVDPMEQMLEMKMTMKKMERESKKADKEEKKQIEKARVAMKKGNEEGARLYLQNAAMKKKESLNLLRMSIKLDAIHSQLKANQSNITMVNSLQTITPYLQYHSQELPIEQIYGQMQAFETAMDDITVQHKMVNEVVNKNTSDYNQDIAVDNMMQQLKSEELNQLNMDMNMPNQQLFNELPQQQQQGMNYNNQQQFQNPNFQMNNNQQQN